MKRFLLLAFLLTAAVSAQAAAPIQSLLNLQQRFSTPAPAPQQEEDLNLKIREIESRVSWLAVDAEYLEQDARMAYQSAANFFLGQFKNLHDIRRAEHFALQGAERAKKLSTAAAQETKNILALTVTKPDESAAQEAQYLLESSQKTAVLAWKASQSAADLHALLLRFGSDQFQRLQWYAELLDRESELCRDEAKRLQKASQLLFQRLKPKPLQ